MLKNQRRKKRIRAKISGTGSRPRIAVYRSNRYLSLQAIDDEKGITLASASTRKDKDDFVKIFAKSLQAKKIKNVVFDRAGYKYHGKVKKIAEDLRSLGLEF